MFKRKNKIRAGMPLTCKKATASYYLTGLSISNERLKNMIEIPQ